ncbi:MAG: histidinol dehydrogenase [Cyclobacteriaceae bacterium]|jgi:histidinol dehydrogenase
MKIIKNPDKKKWSKLLKRPAIKEKEIRRIVKPILKKVKEKGDKALRLFAFEYDHVELDNILVSSSEIAGIEKNIDKDIREAIKMAYKNIKKFHEAQLTDTLEVETTRGVICKRKNVPIERVGLYVPGGSAPLFSTVLMLAIPAKIAGCKEIIICTPSDRNGKIHPLILYAAKLTGVEKIAKVGGAQAIGALAYGTESVPKVDKIFGPGNQYVTAAKQIVNQKGIAIDMPAGPSEVAVIADDSADPGFIASDLLSQAEHGIDSQVILISTDEDLIRRVIIEIKVLSEALPRKHIIEKSLLNSRFFLVENLEVAVELSNAYAPEHLIIATEDYDTIAEKIVNAGSVFLGNYTPESAGDYASGTNHTLPTYGYARTHSGVSVDSFLKKITFQKISIIGLRNLGPAIELMAEKEELEAHKLAISIRLKNLKSNG